MLNRVTLKASGGASDCYRMFSNVNESRRFYAGPFVLAQNGEVSERRENVVGVRLSDKESDTLTRMATRRGLSRSAMLRLAFLDYAAHDTPARKEISGQVEGR